MKTLRQLSFLLLGALLITACGGDPDPVLVSSITATGTSFEDGSAINSDLNAASAAEGVALDAVITVTFDREIVATSATAANVRLSTNGNDVAAAVNATSTTLTIDPVEVLARGTVYTLSMSGITSEDEGELASTTRTFTTEGRAPVIVPKSENQVAYWNFDGSTEDQVGSYVTKNEIAVSFDEDRFGQGSSALSFDGDQTLVEIASGSSLMATDDFTLSFWLKSDGSDLNDNGETRGQFVMGLGAWNGFQFEIFGNYSGLKLAAAYENAEGNAVGQDLWWSTTGDLGWMGWTFDQDVSQSGGLAAIIQDQWAHFVITYDAASKVGSIYINGELRKSQDYNLYGDGHPLLSAVGMKYNGNPTPGDNLAFGFIQGSEDMAVSDAWADPLGGPDLNRYKGLMDDVRVFHASFSRDDVETLFDSERP